MTQPVLPGFFTPTPADAAPSIQQAALGLNTGGTLSNYNQIFAALLPMEWRDVEFPIVETELELVQDQTIHKFVDRDGAHVEGVGRAPLRITARIPFLVGLQQGPNEHWQKPLYPFTWRKFFAACADRTSGTLQHPELGDLNCKCEFAKTKWSGDVRTGVYVNASWIESDDSQTDLTQALENPSPLANLSASAADLDTQLAALDPSQFPQPYTPPFSFSTIVSSTRGTIDSVTILQKQSAGQLDNAIYQAQSVKDAADRAANANAQNWPLYADANQIICAAYDLKASLLNKQTTGIGYYAVPKDSTIAQIAATLGSPVIDIVMLNTGFVAQPVVPKDSVVRYYT